MECCCWVPLTSGSLWQMCISLSDSLSGIPEMVFHCTRAPFFPFSKQWENFVASVYAEQGFAITQALHGWFSLYFYLALLVGVVFIGPVSNVPQPWLLCSLLSPAGCLHRGSSRRAGCVFFGSRSVGLRAFFCSCSVPKQLCKPWPRCRLGPWRWLPRLQLSMQGWQWLARALSWGSLWRISSTLSLWMFCTR